MKYSEDNLNLLDYIFDNTLINDNTYGCLLELKEAFQNIEDFKTVATYEVKLGHAINKCNSKVEDLYNHNKKWLSFLKQARIKNIDIELITPIFTDIETSYYKRLYKDNFKQQLLKILKEIQKIK